MSAVLPGDVAEGAKAATRRSGARNGSRWSNTIFIVPFLVAYAGWVHCDSIRVAQSYTRKEDGTTDWIRVERTTMKRSRLGRRARGTDYRPAKVVVNTAAWDSSARTWPSPDLQSKVPA